MTAEAEHLLQAPVYALPQAAKRAVLLPHLNELNAHHDRHCPAFRRLRTATKLPLQASDYTELPMLATALFKHRQLSSIASDTLYKTLTSSGTTGEASQITLDRTTANLQSKALIKILQQFIGKQRLPMLIIDAPGVQHEQTHFTARSAGALGLALAGRDHHYALTPEMQPDWAAIESFGERYASHPVLLFGFTYMIWQYLLVPLNQANKTLYLPHGILFHSGGWKQLAHRAVDQATFDQHCKASLGIQRVHNFYGMAEQTGSIFIACEQGYLHAPVMADVLIRDRDTLAPLPHGQRGLIQVFSGLPLSYPGHSLLTEDMGVCLGEDDCPCGRQGRYFQVHGRLANAPAKGCSDTFFRSD
mgnify:CR=1 FL=1